MAVPGPEPIGGAYATLYRCISPSILQGQLHSFRGNHCVYDLSAVLSDLLPVYLRSCLHLEQRCDHFLDYDSSCGDDPAAVAGTWTCDDGSDYGKAFRKGRPFAEHCGGTDQLAMSAAMAYAGIVAVRMHIGYSTSLLGYDDSLHYLFVVYIGVMLCVTILLSLIERILKYHKEA